MHTLRSAFMAHLGTSGLLSTVAPLATGEDLAKKGVDLPAVFVAYPGGTVAGRERGELHVFVPGFSELASETSAATDALALAEKVARWLEEHWRFRSEETGRCYAVPLGPDAGGIDVQAGRFRDRHAFYLLKVPVQQE